MFKFIKSIRPPHLFVFFLIYCSGSTVLFGTSKFSVLITAILPDLLFLTIILIWFFKRKNLRMNLHHLSCFLFIFFSLGVMMLVNNDYSLNNIYEVIQLSLAFLLVMFINRDDFERALYNCVLVLCSFSLFSYVLTYFFPSIIRVFPTVENTANLTFHFLGLSVVPNTYLSSSIVRNFGIFREPGVFVCFIGIAYALGKKNNLISLFAIIVFSLTLITTLSTTGYVVLLLLFLTFIIEKKSLSLFFLSIILVGLFVLILKLNTNLLDIDGPVFAKFLWHTSSYNARFGSISQNIELIKLHPIFGAGWEESKAFFLSSYLSTHNTNTYLFFFSCYGFFVGTAYTLGLIKSFIIKNEYILSILLLLIVFVALSGERICFDISLLMLIFYGLDD